MNYNESLIYIHSLSNNLPPTLDRISSLLNLINNPQKELKAIHIAGTNGKGSVASVIAEVLQSKGYNVGLYTSPFIVDFRERIKLNGAMISKTTLAKYATYLKTVVERNQLTIGEFEFITAISFLYYKDMKCDYCVLETGLGGRFDATNTANSIISVITKISLDHIQILGSNITDIAYEKAGIIKNNIPLITCNQPLDAEKVLLSYAKSHYAPIKVTDMDLVTNITINKNETKFSYKGVDYTINLLGAHQIENTIIAIEVLEELIGNFADSKNHYKFPKVFHPARLELVSDNPDIFIDGAHNPDGAKVLSEFLKQINFKGTIIFGAMKDKNVEEVLKALSSVTSKIIVVTVNGMPRAMNAQDIYDIAKKYFNFCVIADSYDDALRLTNNEETVICGSLYFSAHIREKLLQNKS